MYLLGARTRLALPPVPSRCSSSLILGAAESWEVGVGTENCQLPTLERNLWKNNNVRNRKAEKSDFRFTGTNRSRQWGFLYPSDPVISTIPAILFSMYLRLSAVQYVTYCRFSIPWFLHALPLRTTGSIARTVECALPDNVPLRTLLTPVHAYAVNKINNNM